MNAWHIVPQVEKEETVLAKVIRFCPIQDKKSNETRFVKVPPCIRVLIAYSDDNNPIRLTWSSKNDTWSMQQPDKLVKPTIKVGTRHFEDRLAEPKKVPGDKKTFNSKKNFFEKLKERVGSDLASMIESEFEARMSDG